MIHPSAIIEKGAELGKNVRIGPLCYVGSRVQIGDDCELRPRATIVGNTRIGCGCVFFTGCAIGEIPQDLKYRGEHTQTTIGDDNHIRELVTIHAGTALGGGVTKLGDHNRILVGVHVAHDTHIGDHVIISNNVQIAGHCRIEDRVTMGGQSGIHQFVTIGRYAMVGGLSRVSGDVPPYMVTSGYPAEVRGVNLNGLKRWQVDEEHIKALSRAFRVLYSKRRSGGESSLISDRISTLVQSNGQNEHVHYLCEFLNRKFSSGQFGRYLETLRTDTAEDNRGFYETQKEVQT